MISIISLKLLWIFLIINRIAGDQCIQSDPCECAHENGMGYNLHTLGENPNYMQAYSNTSGIEYIFHPCHDISIVPDKGANVSIADCNSGYGVCLYNASAQNYTLLANNKDATIRANPDTTAYLVFTHKNKTTTILLVCTNADQNYLIESPSAGNENEYNLILFTKEACMKEIFTVSTLSTGALLNITFLILVFAYLTVGISVDYFLMGARGVEVIPHLAFWKDFPLLVRDGIKFVQNGCKIQPSDLSENRDIYTSI